MLVLQFPAGEPFPSFKQGEEGKNCHVIIAQKYGTFF
jgi:hypothetical protein